MLIIPAVDIKDGKVVRLLQGKADEETVYGNDPVEAAKRWVDAGATRLHLVDLDGAFEGRPKNMEWSLKVIKEIPIEVQIGGGLRSSDVVSAFLDAGASRCVIGTKAVEDSSFLRDLAERHPGQISVGVDAKGGRVVTHGWVSSSDLTAGDLLGELYELPLAEVIYTDIERDGMLSGPNYMRVEEVLKSCKFPLISSGGVSTVEHIQKLKELNCHACIVGKALYDGKLDLAEAMAAAK